MNLNMIVYDKVARHNFLSEELCKKLVEAGIDMSDASYYLIKIDGVTYVSPTPNIELTNNMVEGDPIPTYTLADMIYKMNEYPYVDGKPFGPLGFFKDAPFYVWLYRSKDKSVVLPNGENSIEAEAETPIEAAAYMLIQSRKNGINLVDGIKDKYDETY